MRVLAGHLLMAIGVRFGACALSGLAVIGFGEARAGVVQFASKATFEAQTDVASTGDFDDYGAGLHVLSPTPFYRAGVTFTQATYAIGANTVASNSTPPLIWNPVRTMSLFAYSAQTSGTIDTLPNRYSSFGFDLGYLNNFVSATHPATTATLVLSTVGPSGNGTYNFSITMPGADESFAFSGFKTDDPLEYFIGFQISGPTSYFPGISEWKLGNPKAPPPPSAVPEPGTVTLAGLACLVLLGRTRVRRVLGNQERSQFDTPSLRGAVSPASGGCVPGMAQALDIANGCGSGLDRAGRQIPE